MIVIFLSLNTISFEEHGLQEGLEIDEPVAVEVHLREDLIDLSLFQALPQSLKGILHVLSSEEVISTAKKFEYFFELPLDFILNT